MVEADPVEVSVGADKDVETVDEIKIFKIVEVIDEEGANELGVDDEVESVEEIKETDEGEIVEGVLEVIGN